MQYKYKNRWAKTRAPLHAKNNVDCRGLTASSIYRSHCLHYIIVTLIQRRLFMTQGNNMYQSATRKGVNPGAMWV